MVSEQSKALAARRKPLAPLVGGRKLLAVPLAARRKLLAAHVVLFTGGKSAFGVLGAIESPVTIAGGGQAIHGVYLLVETFAPP